MSHNPCNEDLLVVCGLTECQLLVINSSGQVTNRSLLHPSVDNVGYIVKALWVPGSQHELVLISDSFVKIYDTHLDVISPTYYFILDEGTIKDATVAVSDEVYMPFVLCGSTLHMDNTTHFLNNAHNFLE